MQKYHLIESSSIGGLMRDVQSYLDRGWVVTGGPTFNGRGYVQAVVTEVSTLGPVQSQPRASMTASLPDTFIDSRDASWRKGTYAPN